MTSSPQAIREISQPRFAWANGRLTRRVVAPEDHRAVLSDIGLSGASRHNPFDLRAILRANLGGDFDIATASAAELRESSSRTGTSGEVAAPQLEVDVISLVVGKHDIGCQWVQISADLQSEVSA